MLDKIFQIILANILRSLYQNNTLQQFFQANDAKFKQNCKDIGYCDSFQELTCDLFRTGTLASKSLVMIEGMFFHAIVLEIEFSVFLITLGLPVTFQLTTDSNC